MFDINNDVEIVKKPHGKVDYGAGGSEQGQKNFSDLLKCAQDPLFFMRNFMKARHPLKGSVPFDPYPYQVKLVEAFQSHRFNIILAGRQLGKCSTFYSIINKDGKQVKIGSLIKISLKEYCVSLLEKALLYCAKRT